MKMKENIKSTLISYIAEEEPTFLYSESPTLDRITEILAHRLPQPNQFAVTEAHFWSLDSAIGSEVMTLVIDNSYQESNWDFESPIIEDLNNIPETEDEVKVTASNPADGIILLNLATVA